MKNVQGQRKRFLPAMPSFTLYGVPETQGKALEDAINPGQNSAILSFPSVTLIGPTGRGNS